MYVVKTQDSSTDKKKEDGAQGGRTEDAVNFSRSYEDRLPRIRNYYVSGTTHVGHFSDKVKEERVT